ncbi:MAG: 2-hydroxyacyl-CoA dehydratase [Bacillota bacterium]|nr:2-hydroxyacyl-CoA dehydratase [Bacillota bacterium]
MKTIGITTTVPVEILIAAGYNVVDINNIFVTAEDYGAFIDKAERDGFPKSHCAWKKGMYGVIMDKGIEEIVGVMEGDCSNTKALVDVLKMNNIKVNPFMYPANHTLENVKISLDNFMKQFNVTLEQVEKVRKRCNEVRKVLKDIDRLTYEEGKATGFENHLFQVSSSDFNSNLDEFEKMVIEKRDEIAKRKPNNKKIRLGYIGVPPMTTDIYSYVENFDAHFVYNEVQREFAFPRGIEHSNIYEQYYDYTYPYDIDFRLVEIKKQIKERKIDAVIHYTQAFCYRAVEDIVIKKALDVPVLNIEGDKINTLDGRTKLRLEAFLDMINDLKEMGQ